MSISLVAPDAEKQLLASMMSSRVAPATAMAMGLRDEDFGFDAHRMVYASMRELINGGGQVDVTTVKAHLESSGLLDVIGETFIDSLESDSGNPQMVSDYVKVIKDRHLRRGITDAIEEIVADIHSLADPKALVERVQTHMFRATDSYMTTAYNGVRSKAIRQHFYTRTSDHDKVLSSFNTINGINGGRSRGSLTVWAAYPSDGKSSIGRTEAIKAARGGSKTAIFSLEMSEEEVIATTLSGMSGIDSRIIEAGTYNDTQRAVLDACFDEIEQWDLTIYSDATITPQDIRSIQLRERYDFMVVDYLQRFDFTEWSEVGRIAKQFKNLALSTNSCVDLLSQITPPGVNPGENPFPRASMQNLYGGKATSHEANNIFILNCTRELVDGSWKRTGEGDIYCAKFRGGRAEFVFPVRFSPEKISWEEC